MKVFLINIFLLIFISTIAQTDSVLLNGNNKISFGASLSYFTNFDLTFKDGFAFTTAAIINNDKHLISIAPVWWIDKNRNANFFKGAMLSYLFFPKIKQDKLNFYFIYDLLYSFEKNEWERFMNYSPSVKYTVAFNSRLNTLSNQAGYGINIKIFKRFYIFQSMSAGVEFYNFNSNTEVKENSSLSTEYSSGNIFSASRTSGFFKIGIGHNFEK